MIPAIPQVQNQPRFHLPILDYELSAQDKKVVAVALATMALFGIQLGFSLAVTCAIAFTATVLTYLSEKYLRTDPEEKNDWFNPNFDKKKLAMIVGLFFLRSALLIFYYKYMGLVPLIPQVGILEAIKANPLRMVAIAGVVAPISEEILFRGFLLERFEDALSLLNTHTVCRLPKETRETISQLFQAVVFGAVHLNRAIEKGYKMGVFVVLSISGYLFGLLKKEDETLISPIAIHSANNFSSLLFMYGSGVLKS